MMALFSACEHAALQEPVSPEGNVSGDAAKTQIFTATLGAETKVYLDYDSDQNVYKTVWDEDDYIYVINPDTEEYERCYIVEGVGTTTAKFAGTIEADQYIAFYGTFHDFYDGEIRTYLSPYQYQNSYWDNETYTEEYRISQNRFPMVAKSENTTFNFQNLCSVLKVNLTGNGEEVQNIYVKSNDSKIAVSGDTSVDCSGSEPVLVLPEVNDESDNLVYASVYTSIWEEAKGFYIVLPAQTYKGGLTFIVETKETTMEVSVTEDIEMKRSRIRNVNLNYQPNGWNEPDHEWVVNIFDAEGVESKIPMTFEKGYMVAKGVTLSTDNTFYFKNVDWDESWSMSDYDYNYYWWVPMNTAVYMYYYYYECPSRVLVGGTYDLYFDTYNRYAFVMESGVSLEDIPTKEYVLARDYENLYNNVSDGSLTKVQGLIRAKAGHGVIVALDNYASNTIFVYDQDDCLTALEVGDYVNIYSEKSTYRDLAELIYKANTHWYSILGQAPDLGYPSATDITQSFDEYNSSSYTYISFAGTLRLDGSNYYVDVKDSGVIGHVAQPLKNLDEYVGNGVLVTGYFMGRTNQNDQTYIHMVMTDISAVNTGGSTNDVLPGGDITVTR